MRLENIETGRRDQPVEAAVPDTGTLDWIRRRRDTLRQRSVEDFDVPGYLGSLVARIRRLPHEQHLGIYDSSAVAWERCAQLLIDSCVGLYRRDDADELVEIPGPVDGQPATWVDLARTMGDDVTDAQQAVLGVLADNEQALVDFAKLIDQWMGSADERTDEQLLGG